MKKVALVGFGFMGRTHCGAWKKCRGAKVVAVCESDLTRLAAKVEGNIAGVADNARLPKSVRIYDDFARLLADGGFDIVDLATPTALHAEMAVAALKAGYHVLCEKPMALTLRDCDRMLAAAKRSGRELLVAQCVRFFPEYAYVRKLVRSRRYGRVVAADFSRFVSPPEWARGGADAHSAERRSGGVLFDVHVHDADFVLGTFGRPRRVSAAVHLDGNGLADHTSTTYFYKDMLVTSDSSCAAAASLKWEATGRVFFERATVEFGTSFKTPLTVYPQNGRAFSPRLGSRTGYEAEVEYFLAQVEGRLGERILTARDARDAVALLLQERVAAQFVGNRRKRPVPGHDDRLAR